MSMSISAISAALQGNWTRSGLVKQLSFLSELSSRCKDSIGEVHIDCSGIENIDKHGFQVLQLWLSCLYSRGYQPKIIKMSAAIRELQARYKIPIFECNY